MADADEVVVAAVVGEQGHDHAGTLRCRGVGRQRLHQPVDVVALGLHVHGQAVLCGGGARHGPDRDDPRALRRPGAGLEQEADGRARGEGHVGGALERRRARRRRAARRRSRRERRRRPRRRARAARPAARLRASAARATSTRRPSTSTGSSASTSASATKRSGTTSARTPRSFELGGGAGPDRGDRGAGERASVAAGLAERVEEEAHAVRAREADQRVLADALARRRAARPRAGAARSGWPGVSTTSAPSSRSRAARPLACARARVTATTSPCSGRRSSHAIVSRSPATRPTRVIAGGRMPSASTRAAMPASVSTTVRWPG